MPGSIGCRSRSYCAFRITSFAEGGEERAVPRVPRRHHAVEHVDAPVHAFHQVLRRSHAHQVARLVLGQRRHRRLEHLVHHRLGLAHGQAADGVAVEPDLDQRLGRCFRRSGYMPPCTMPNSAWPVSFFASRQRLAQRSVRSSDSRA